MRLTWEGPDREDPVYAAFQARVKADLPTQPIQWSDRGHREPENPRPEAFSERPKFPDPAPRKTSRGLTFKREG